MALPTTSFRNGAKALTTAAIIGLSALGSFPAAAQQALLPAEQCRNAIIISNAIKDRYNGRLSAKLIASFGQFRDSNCDLNTPFTRVEGTADEDAFGEFRLKLIVLRRTASKPAAALANR